MKYVLLLALGVALIITGTLRGEPEERPRPKPNRVADSMHLKLESAQKVLEGLALEDFQLIEKESQAISLLTQENTWKVLQTPEYVQYSSDFRRTVDALTEAARKKNLDGAALRYVEMTMKCVQCHKYVRDVRLADGRLQFPGIAAERTLVQAP
jgi:hypothetical protein